MANPYVLTHFRQSARESPTSRRRSVRLRLTTLAIISFILLPWCDGVAGAHGLISQPPAPSSSMRITNCGAATVNADLQRGGSYIFDCSGASLSVIEIDAPVTIRAGRSLALSVEKGHTVELLGAFFRQIAPFVAVLGGSFSAQDLEFSDFFHYGRLPSQAKDGRPGKRGLNGSDASSDYGNGGNGTPAASGTIGQNGAAGGSVAGGVLLVRSGRAKLVGDTFYQDVAQGAIGASGGSEGPAARAARAGRRQERSRGATPVTVDTEATAVAAAREVLRREARFTARGR